MGEQADVTLIEHYVALRQAHIGLVALSGGWFALRAVGQLAGARWPLTLPARAASWVIDTGLLTAGALLWAALQINPLVQTWLGAKLVLLVVYVGLGTMALRRARSTLARLGWTLAALGCFAFMVSVALAHHPLGGLAAR
jgi:uncharacterized membrane protein SirB2